MIAHHRACRGLIVEPPDPTPTMYAQHLGLNQEPFSIAPDPRFLFMSARHREALAHLLYGVSDAGRGAGNGGFVLLTGDIGTGKTTVCRCFLEQVPSTAHVAYIFNPKLSVIELLQSICEEFHIALPSGTPPSAKVCIDALNAFLLSSHADGHSCVLIIDEAQNLEPAVLEQLRLLTNLETNERKLLQIVLIGQPELRTMLAAPELEQLAQRVIARFHLQALNMEETRQYIAHRLAVAGHQGAMPFDAGALSRIHQLSQGVPRRINLLCDRALLGAWAHQLERVERRVVDTAAAEVFGTPAPTSGARWRTPAIAVSGAAVLALTLLLWSRSMPPNGPQAQVKAPSSPVANAAVTAPAPLPTPPRPAAASAKLDSLLAQAGPSMDQSWQALSTLWQQPVSEPHPCASDGLKPWQCYQTSKLNLVQLRQLDRPGIISLRNAKGESVNALLIGLNAHSALLQVHNQRYQIGQLALAQVWRGDFATLWQAPESYQEPLRDGAGGPAIEALAQGLAQLDGQSTGTKPLQLNADLRTRVRNFQRHWGLDADGQPGPLTFMQLARANNAPGPRLQTDFD
jgi:general secretion pathway protein A